MEIIVEDKIWDRWREIFGEKAEDELSVILNRVANRGKDGKMRTTITLTQDHAEFLDTYCFLFAESRINLLSRLITKLEVNKTGELIKETSKKSKPVTIHFQPELEIYRHLGLVAQARNCSHSLIVEEIIEEFRKGLPEEDLRVIQDMITRKKKAA